VEMLLCNHGKEMERPHTFTSLPLKERYLKKSPERCPPVKSLFWERAVFS
jgi:hypothetical protein